MNAGGHIASELSEVIGGIEIPSIGTSYIPNPPGLCLRIRYLTGGLSFLTSAYDLVKYVK